MDSQSSIDTSLYVNDVHGATDPLSAMRSHKAVGFTNDVVARNLESGWESMYDMLRIAKNHIERQRAKREDSTALWQEEEDDLLNQMASAEAARNNAKKQVEDLQREIDRMKHTLQRSKEKQAMLEKEDTVLEQRIG